MQGNETVANDYWNQHEKRRRGSGGTKSMGQLNMKDSQNRKAYVTNKPFKSKVKAIEDYVFKMGQLKMQHNFPDHS